MLPTTPGVQRLLNPLTGVVVTLTWALIALRAMTAEHPISLAGLVAATAIAISGIGFGVLAASFAIGHARRRGRTVPAPGLEGTATFFLLIGLVEVGWGMEPALQASPTAWTWFSLLFSFAGGASMGLGILLAVGRAPSRELRADVPSQDPPTLP